MINIDDYLQNYFALLKSNNVVQQLQDLSARLQKQRANKGRLLIFGNGASASIASHAALDFTKQGKLETLCFHDPALITAYANDYEYKNAFKEILISYSNTSDIVFLVSVSGESPNLIEVAKEAKAKGIYSVSFTGRYSDNSLSLITDEKFWVDSHAYNIVENIHSIWITTLIDYLVGKAEYEVK